MALSHCPICGCGELRHDEVHDRGLLLLTECPRCQHRSVERAAEPARRVSREWEAPEVAA